MTIPLCSYPGPRRAACLRALFALHRTGFGEPPRRRDAGGLLPHLFTLTTGELYRRAGKAVPTPERHRKRCLCGENDAGGGLLSVPLSVGFRRLACASILPCGVRTFLDARRRRGHPACTPNSSSARASSLPIWPPHSGQKTTPARACMTNSPQTRHSSEAPRSSASSSCSSERANGVISVTAPGRLTRRGPALAGAWGRAARARHSPAGGEPGPSLGRTS